MYWDKKCLSSESSELIFVDGRRQVYVDNYTEAILLEGEKSFVIL